MQQKDIARDSHTKSGTSEREKQLHDITYMWNLNYSTKEPICKTERLTDIKNRLRLLIAGGEGRKWDGLEVWG